MAGMKKGGGSKVAESMRKAVSEVYKSAAKNLPPKLGAEAMPQKKKVTPTNSKKK